MMRVLVGNRFGQLIGELTPDVGPVLWALNRYGKTTLSLAKTDPKANADMLQVSNRLMIQFDDGLPDWGGIIDLPRRWTADKVEVTCYTIEYLLQYRYTDKNDAFYNNPTGAIFYELLRKMEEAESIGLRFGPIWTGGRGHWPRYHYKSIYRVLTESLRRMERCDFRFTPFLESGRILFRAEFGERLGVDRSATVALVEGANIVSTAMEEQGPLINRAIAVGAGSTWGNERAVAVGEDAASYATYGLRAKSEIASGVSQYETLEGRAERQVIEASVPRRRFGLSVADAAPGLFADYDVADTVRAILPGYGFGGFDGSVRVLAREYKPNGSCDLVVEEEQTVLPWVYLDREEEESS